VNDSAAGRLQRAKIIVRLPAQGIFDRNGATSIPVSGYSISPVDFPDPK
jgi:hypothetical protein